MSGDAKKFIVAADVPAYRAMARGFGFAPSACFFCGSVREAVHGVLVNWAKGIAADIWTEDGILRLPELDAITRRPAPDGLHRTATMLRRSHP